MEVERERKRPLSVLITEGRCVIATIGLIRRGRLSMPPTIVGTRLRFADGSVSRIYRETVMRGMNTSPRVMLAVRFRLRFLGSSRVGHALFRFESLFNTLLFAAHRGFHTKLWLTDRVTDFYRGIYEWEDEVSAIEYAETLRVVMTPWAKKGTFEFRVIQGAKRPEYLEGRIPPTVDVAPGDDWWVPVAGNVRCGSRRWALKLGSIPGKATICRIKIGAGITGPSAPPMP